MIAYNANDAFGNKKSISVQKNPTLQGYWVHKSYSLDDSIEKSIISLFGKGYGGIEIDIFWDSKKRMFYVAHDEMVEQEREYLNDYLDVIDKSQYSIWLDWKNLSYDNVYAGSKSLEALFESLITDRRIIYIESPRFLYLFVLSLINDVVEPLYTVRYIKNDLSFMDFLRNIINYPVICYADNIATSYYDVLAVCENNKQKKIFFTEKDSRSAAGKIKAGFDFVLIDLFSGDRSDDSKQ